MKTVELVDIEDSGLTDILKSSGTAYYDTLMTFEVTCKVCGVVSRCTRVVKGGDALPDPRFAAMGYLRGYGNVCAAHDITVLIDGNTV